MHAFDRDLLHGPVGVRLAREGEALTLLDGRDVVVDPGFLVIADNDRAVALAGVMGGFDTRVTETTKNVFLEAAHFAPSAVIGRGRKLGLRSEEHTSELQSLMRISYAVFVLKKKTKNTK